MGFMDKLNGGIASNDASINICVASEQVVDVQHSREWVIDTKGASSGRQKLNERAKHVFIKQSH